VKTLATTDPQICRHSERSISFPELCEEPLLDPYSRTRANALRTYLFVGAIQTVGMIIVSDRNDKRDFRDGHASIPDQCRSGIHSYFVLASGGTLIVNDAFVGSAFQSIVSRGLATSNPLTPILILY
jgi:hypothetical protein